MGIHQRRLDLDGQLQTVHNYQVLLVSRLLQVLLARSNFPGKPWSVSKNRSFFFFLFFGGFEAGAAAVLQFAVILFAHQ